MRLGFVSARSAALDGDRPRTQSGLTRLFQRWLAVGCELEVALSLSPRPQVGHDAALPDGAAFHPLPWLPSIARGFSKVMPCRRVVAELEERCDVLVVQLPFEASLALLGARRPRVYHLCADALALARTSHAYRGALRVAAVGGGLLIEGIQRRLVAAPATRVVANGAELGRRYRGRVVVSSTLSERELGSVTRARPPGAFRVLYSGFLRHEKGVDVLLRAFAAFRAVRPDAELHLIGGAEPTDHGAPAELLALARRLEIAPVLRGHLRFGPELFQAYADADVLVLPSRSEGTPRVLVEARAFGCPVIATRVGGIPSSVSDGEDGLLVPPEDAAAIAAALLEVAERPDLRERLIAGGRTRARRHTVEALADTLLEEAHLALQHAPRKNP